jgi:hypothetical protein
MKLETTGGIVHGRVVEHHSTIKLRGCMRVAIVRVPPREGVLERVKSDKGGIPRVTSSGVGSVSGTTERRRIAARLRKGRVEA